MSDLNLFIGIRGCHNKSPQTFIPRQMGHNITKISSTQLIKTDTEYVSILYPQKTCMSCKLSIYEWSGILDKRF